MNATFLAIRLGLLVIVIAAGVHPGIGCAGEPPADPKKLATEEVERLVEQLANPGKRPFDAPYVLSLPKGLSESDLIKSQQPIAAAYNALSSNIEASLPALIAHSSDNRFSYVYEDGISGVFMCTTVGGACCGILDAHVNVYRSEVIKYDAQGRSESLSFPIIDWEKVRPNRTLADLQLERIEWARRQSQPDFFSDREWKAARKSLAKQAKQIRTSQMPVRVQHRVQFFSK